MVRILLQGLLLALLAGLLVNPASAGPYTDGYVWDRQADWTPGPGYPTAPPNPDDDVAGNPVWSYEYQQGVPRNADLDTSDSVTPWYELPVTGMMYWHFSMGAGDEDKWFGIGAQATPGAFQSDAGGGGGTTIVNTPVVRWVNPLTTPSLVRIDGSFTATAWDGDSFDSGVGDVDFVIAHQMGAGTPQAVYSWAQRNLTESQVPIAVSLPSPITVIVQPGDSILFSVTSKPGYGDIATQGTINDNLSITLLSQGPVPINYITGETLAGQFTTGPGGGLLNILDTCSVFIDAPWEETHIGATMALTAMLVDDRSTGGRAIGDFAGGTLTVTAAGGLDIVTFNLDSLTLEELTSAPGILAGVGMLTVTGGYYQDSFAGGGQLVQITFDIPGGLDDFKSGFSCVSNLTISPIPEPASLSLLAVGALALLRRRRAA